MISTGLSARRGASGSGFRTDPDQGLDAREGVLDGGEFILCDRERLGTVQPGFGNRLRRSVGALGPLEVARSSTSPERSSSAGGRR